MAAQVAMGTHCPDYQQQTLYQQILPVVRQLLELTLENESEESTNAVAMHVISFEFDMRFHDGRDISSYLPPQHTELVLRGHILEAFLHWVRERANRLDEMVPLTQSGTGFLAREAHECKQRLEQALYSNGPWEHVFAELIAGVAIEFLGRDAVCLASALGGMLINELDKGTLLHWVEYPSYLLAAMVRKLEDIQAKVGKLVMEIYHDQEYMVYDNSKNVLMKFFQYFTVEATDGGTLEVHETCDDQLYLASPFRVHLIDSFGGLVKLLLHLEDICSASSDALGATLAVDFEGLKLCRHGALCLVQMTCSDDPRLVYVLDVHTLGRKAFTMQTLQGTCMKAILEEQNIRKVWFDPRNDVDALYHQFDIMPRGIFDLQLAEVAVRRSRGLNVNYVQGLYKCLTLCPELQSEQKLFAKRINDMGKGLFEPQLGGSYEIFQRRPLNPVILVYAAHDSRYMLVLHEQYVQSLDKHWVERVLRAGDVRAQWCLSREYAIPSSEAPDF